ncbi:MAG: TonB family protein, partial [Vicinamibacterales bacterium]
QFDTKGVEFGPWIRRFIAQVRRNWEPLIPQAAWSMHGHVIVTFNVNKSGRISDLSVVKPAELDAFNTAAYGALASSNPTVPLPPEYPSDQAFFTVTFFYNEQPPER